MQARATRVDHRCIVQILVGILAIAMLLWMGWMGTRPVRAGLASGSGLAPMTDPVTTTPTATSTAGVVTPVPVGSWVAWPERPTDALPLEGIELRDVYFPTPDEGWAVGFGSNRGWYDVAIILHYQNGHWSVDESLPQADRDEMRLHAIAGTGPDNIWAVGKDYKPLIYRDGDVAALVHYDGEKWSKLDVSFLGRAAWAVLTDIAMVVNDAGDPEGWAISRPGADGRGSYILHLVNGRWEMQTEVNSKILWTIDMVSASDGWIVAEDERRGINFFFWYRDGTWENKSSWGGPMYAVSMADALYGWAVGPSGNADEYVGECHHPLPNRPCHWLQFTITNSDGRIMGIDFQDIQLLSRYDGWLVGKHRDASSSVVHYERIAEDVTVRVINWRPMEIANDPVQDLYGIYMLPGPDGWAVDGWAVGAGGAILHYEGPAQPASPTPTATLTSTSTPQPTPMPTSTATSVATPTATWTVTPSATPSLTPSPTPTPSVPLPKPRLAYLPFVARGSAGR